MYGQTDSQAAADAATAKAQHAAALAAIAARQSGDQAAYDAAIQQLYELGITNAAQATAQDLQNIADTANKEGLFGGLERTAKWVAIGLVALLAYPLVLSRRRRT